MPRLNSGQAPLFVDISPRAKKTLEKAAKTRGIPMGELLDEAIAAARKEFSPADVKKPKRSETLSLIIREYNKEWLKTFSEKTNVRMAPLVEMIIEEML